MKVKTLRVVLPMLTAVLLISGCGHNSTTQQDILDMLNTSDNITIELTVEKDENEGYKYNVNWIQLGDMTSSKEIRASMDEQFKITGNAGNKNGVFYVNEVGENTQNNTLAVAMRNRAVTSILNSDTESINMNIATQYTDLDVDEEKAIYCAISDYFELLKASENGESNINDSLSRAEAMSLVFKAMNPVSEIERNSVFDSAVGTYDLNAFASAEDKNAFISTSDGSLNETTYTQSMTKAEYIYLVMNEVFGNQTVQSTDSSIEFNSLQSAGDLRADKKLIGKQQLSSAIIKEFVNNPTSIDESLYKAIVLADSKGIISSVEDLDSAIRKADAVEILCKALMQNQNIEEFNYDRGTVDTGYEYAVPESVEEIEASEAQLTDEEVIYMNSDDYNTEEEVVTEPQQPEVEVDYTVEEISTIMYATQTVNVRDLPTTEGNKVGSKSYAEKVEVTGKVTSYKGEKCLWYQLSDGTFVSGNYLSESKPAQQTSNNNSNSGNTSNNGGNSSNSGSSNNSGSNSSGSSNGISQSQWDALFADDGGDSTAGGDASAGGSSGGGAHID